MVTRSTGKAVALTNTVSVPFPSSCGTEMERVPTQCDRYGGVAVIALRRDIPDINPLTSLDGTANQAQQFILFTPLLTYDGHLRPIARAAESWEVNEDSTAITFHLRRDLHWHDGVVTTAYDWKYSYDMARHPETAFPNSALWTHYGSATALDSFTFRVEMEPHAEFLDPWRAFTAVPRHILADVPASDIRSHAFNNADPIGNGPFRFVSHSPNREWVFEANSNYPAALGGRPYLDRVVFRIIPEPNTLIAELLTGSVDFANPPPEQAQRIAESGSARIFSYSDRAFVPIIWNSRRPFFRDPRVRRALTMAIDRNAIIDGVLHGYGKVSNSTVPPFSWQYDPDAGADLAYNPEQAGRLLTEAGWEDRDGDGIRENAEGIKFRFEMWTGQGTPARVDVLHEVQSHLAKVGVASRPRVLEAATLISVLSDPTRRDFDAALVGWITEFRSNDTDLFHCSRLNGQYQWSGYCDPEADSLLDILPTITDREASMPLWSRYQRKLAADQPYTFLYFAERVVGVSNRLQDAKPDVRGDFVNIAQWWLASAAK